MPVQPQDRALALTSAPLNTAEFGLHPSNPASVNSTYMDQLVAKHTSQGGGAIDVPDMQVDLARGLVFTAPVRLRGEFGGRDASRPGSALVFPANATGVLLGYWARNSSVSDLRLMSAGGTLGHGVRTRAARTIMERLYVEDFPGHGYFVDTDAITATALSAVGTTVTVTLANHSLLVGEQITVSGMAPAAYNRTTLITAVPSADTFQYVVTSAPSGPATTIGVIYAGNANLSRVQRVTATTCGGDGVLVAGPNANGCKVESADCGSNGGTGIRVKNASACRFSANHAVGNLMTVTDVVTGETMTVDYVDDGGSNSWDVPYTESGKGFLITGNAPEGKLGIPGSYARPDVWSGNPGTTLRHNADVAVSLGWDIKLGNKQYGQVILVDTGTGKEVRLEYGIAADGRFAVHNITDNIPLFGLYGDGSRVTFAPTVAKIMDVGSGGMTIGINDAALVGAHGFKTERRTVTGSRGGNAALASLITHLASKGYVADGSTA